MPKASIAAQEEVQQQLPSAEIPQLVRIPEAAKLTGLPVSLLRKSFISEWKRPKNIPPPPPHKRIGRSIYILTDKLPEWVEALAGTGGKFLINPICKSGRPTVAERIIRRRKQVS